MTSQDTLHLKDSLDPRALRWQWRIQRVAWAVVALLVLAALAGVFGKGPVSRETSSASAGGVVADVEYQRFSRTKNPGEVQVTVSAPGQAPGTDLVIVLTDTFAAGANIQAVTPGPEATALRGGAAVYRWTVEDWSHPVTVAFRYNPDMAYGILEGEVRVQAGDGPPLTVPLRQVLYP